MTESAITRSNRILVKPVRLLVRGNDLLAFGMDRREVETMAHAALALRLHTHRVRRVVRAEDVVVVTMVAEGCTHTQPVNYDARGYVAVLGKET